MSFPRQPETETAGAAQIAAAADGTARKPGASVDFAQEAAALVSAVAALTPPEPEAAERALRHELATAEDPAASALELVGLLCAAERHEEALHVVQQAEARSRDPRLRLARVGVQRELGRRHLAAAELHAFVLEHGAKTLHPGLLFELAELNWLEGNGPSALTTLLEIDDLHRDDPWCRANRQQLADLAAEIRRGQGPQRVRVVDLLGNLRGAPSASTRIAVLEQLAKGTGSDEDANAKLRARAVAIALGDEVPVVRARAVQLARPSAETAAELCRTGLADDAAIVRQFAAARAVELLGPSSAPMLLDTLAKEQDPATFLALHQSLGKLGKTAPQLPIGGGETAEGRLMVVDAWRQQWPR